MLRVLQDIGASVSTCRFPLEQAMRYSAPQSRVVKEHAAGTRVPSIREAIEEDYDFGA